MARSCKTLRDFFMSKVSAPVWAASRNGIGLPPCPPDLSEPQYADLLFSKGCYVRFSRPSPYAPCKTVPIDVSCSPSSKRLRCFQNEALHILRARKVCSYFHLLRSISCSTCFRQASALWTLTVAYQRTASLWSFCPTSKFCRYVVPHLAKVSATQEQS